MGYISLTLIASSEGLLVLVWAVPLHCAVAVIMYSDACVFPSKPLGAGFGKTSRMIASRIIFKPFVELIMSHL